jgi:hypothetical protein
MKNMVVSIVAIVGIVVMEVMAMQAGIDGTALSGATLAIGGIAGYGTKAYLDKRKAKGN